MLHFSSGSFLPLLSAAFAAYGDRYSNSLFSKTYLVTILPPVLSQAPAHTIDVRRVHEPSQILFFQYI